MAVIKYVDMPVTEFLQILDTAVKEAGRPIAGAELKVLGVTRKDLRKLGKRKLITAHPLRNNRTHSLEIGYTVAEGVLPELEAQ